MFVIRIVLVTSWWWMVTTALMGQTLYRLDPKLPVHPLDSLLEVLVDTSGEMTFSEAAVSTDWVPLVTIRQAYSPRIDGYHLPVGPAAYFARARIISNRKMTGWQLHLEDRLFDNVAWIRGNGLVEMRWYYDSLVTKGPFHTSLTGVDAPPGQRDIPNDRTKDRLRFEAPADTAFLMLLRLEGNAFGFPPYLNATVRAPGYQFYHPFLPWRSAFNSFMLGAALIMLVTHLLLFFYLRERVYAWFSLWLLLCMLVQGMTIGLDLRDWLPFYHQDFRFLVWLVIPNTMIFGFWLFGRAFVRSYERYPGLDRFMLGLPLAMIFIVLLQVVRVLWFDPERTFTILTGHYELILLFSLAGIVLGLILATKKNDVLARYFGIGAVVASLFTTLGALWSLRLIQLPADPYSVGIFSQFVLYSFGIAYRRQQITRRGHREELAAQTARAEVSRLQDLNDLKGRFFANVSHEFRTPLTLISSPLERAAQRRLRPDQEAKSGVMLTETEYSLIRQNAQRLEQLVDQLLELSRLENEVVSLHLNRGDVIAFIRTLVASFESLAERAGVDLVAYFPEPCPTAHYDADKLNKIIVNLITNAIKYTPVRGTVSVSVDCFAEHFSVEVRDTGPGIAPTEIDHIFDRFYRVAGTEAEGSGIGLALVKELVDVYQGTITVSSTMGKGSTFRVRLPHAKSELPAAIMIANDGQSAGSSQRTVLVEQSKVPDSQLTTADTKEALVLVVEDHLDLRNFLAELLSPKYRVITASDGYQGERMAIEHLPELIVSDVMMPGQDGYALCNALKQNSKTSHVPIILLTARADQQDTIDGLSQGADDYLTKPFDGKELMLRIENLLQGRRKLWAHFQRQDLTLLPEVDNVSLDDQFLQTLASTITNNLSDASLNVDVLARAVGFSQSQLTRKLKALTNKTPNQLITEMRLQEARRQLEKGQSTVAEIAYLVGYTSPSYFTRRFRDYFNCLPSEITIKN